MSKSMTRGTLLDSVREKDGSFTLTVQLDDQSIWELRDCNLKDVKIEDLQVELVRPLLEEVQLKCERFVKSDE
jgi:hypothetical protein